MKPSNQEVNALLRQDLPSFIAKSFQTLNGGECFLPNWHIDSMARDLEQCREGLTKRLIITLPPRYLKSICVSVAFPAWLLGHDPTRKIICASYSNDLAGKHARDCREIMESRWYRKIFPSTHLDRRHNTELDFQTSAHGCRYSTSVGGTLTGIGGNYLIIDDPMKAADANSEAERRRVKEWFNTTAYTRLNNKNEDVIIIVMQRLHVDDLVGHLLEQEDHGWTVLDIPAIAEDDRAYQIGDNEFHMRRADEVLHEARENAAMLDAVKRRIGSYTFAA
ncbi:MAG TPA: hypothetical protein VIX35_00155, partial [Vicinamibacterales bacterium]